MSRKSKGHISASSPPIWLKFRLWAFWKIPLGPFEMNFCPNSTPSMVDGSGDKTQIERGVQWIFYFLHKYAMKLIWEPNFFSKLFLIIGLYDALLSSGLKTQPFLSYSNGWTDRTSQYCINFTFSVVFKKPFRGSLSCLNRNLFPNCSTTLTSCGLHNRKR